MFGSNEQHGWASPLTVMPTNMTNEWSFKDLFHVRGRNFRKHRNNNCVAPNFICGVNLKEPRNLEDTCKERVGNWTFYDFSSEKCSKNYNFFVAKWENQCTNKGCKENNYGFIELSEASISFENLRKMPLIKTNYMPQTELKTTRQAPAMK